MNRRQACKLMAGALGAGCSRQRGRSGRQVRVGVGPYITMSAFHLTHERGFFEEEGLEVEIVDVARTTQQIPLLAAGELDAGLIGFTPGLFTAIAKGAPLRVVAGRDFVAKGCRPTGTLYGRREVFPEGLSDASLLRGKVIGGGQAAGLTEFWLDQILREGGLSPRDVQLIPMRAPERVAALLGGRVDAIAESDFEVELSEVTDEVVRGISMADVLPGLQYSFIAFGAGMLDRDRDVGVSFLAAYVRGVQAFLTGDTPRFMIEFAERAGMNVDSIRNRCRDSQAPRASIDEPSLQTYMDWARSKGYLREELEAVQAIDKSYIREAQARVSATAGARG